MRTVVAVGAAIAALALILGPARRSSADLSPGDIRTIPSRSGVVYREKPRALAKPLGTLPYGSKVKVQEVEGLYVRVATDDATADGWVRAGDLVEPTRLTGDATVTAPASGSDKVVTADLTAASRMLTGGQFSVKTEKTYRKMQEGSDLDAAYRAVDALEKSEP